MTPPRNPLRRILRARDEQPQAATPDAAGDEREPDEPRRRRRGKRGGRGRKQNGEQTTTPQTRNDTTTSNEAPAERGGRRGGSKRDDDQGGKRDARPAAEGNGSKNGAKPAASEERPKDYSWGRRVGGDEEARRELDQRRRSIDRRRRGYRPPRDRLDQPLPEDVAFRAADEGGDRTLLPGRRRRPKGLRTTERVLLGGTRLLTGFVRRPLEAPEQRPDAEHEEGASNGFADEMALRDPELDDNGAIADTADLAARDLAQATAAEETTDTTEATAPAEDEADAERETSPRRRRGRRGGRGRSRKPAPEANGVASEPASEPADEPEAEAPEEAPKRSPRPARKATGSVDERDYPAAFRALGLTPRTLQVLAEFGFEEPTPIQERAIPVLLRGDDVVGLAQTGSGKTVAFGAPMVEMLDPESPEVQALVLVPTRELAQQVLDVLSDLGAPSGLDAVGLLGGHALSRDFAALKRRPHIVVGTPGRVIDHLQRGTLSLSSVTYAVLDEADQMLDIGFLPDIRRILGRTPRKRQTALFSATMPTTIKRLIWQFMREPETVSVDPELSTVESVQQVYFEVASRDKTKAVRELVERELKGRTLVFCKMKRGVDRLTRDLQGAGIRVGALHGDMDQRKRDQVVQRFRQGELDILIATNVAARGLDIPEITHVVNFDVPQNAEEYVHRIGRTGRAGREGKAITFVSEVDLSEFEVILEEFGDDLQRERLDLYS